MRYARLLLMTAIAVAFAAGCGDSDPTGPAVTTEEFDWRGTIAPGNRIEIENILGDVQASYTSGDEVVVHAIKTGRDSDPASVTIEVVRHGDGVTICAVYPDVPGREPNECLPGLQGNMSSRDNDVRVEFTLLVPAGVEFVGRVLNGDVEAVNLQSDVVANTLAGDVTVTTAGIADATSSAGSVNVTIGRADPGRDLAFIAIHGDVTVRIPSNTNAEVLATTGTGTIASDFSLGGTPTWRTGTLGNGGPRLTLSAMDGNVSLRRGPTAQP